MSIHHHSLLRRSHPNLVLDHLVPTLWGDDQRLLAKPKTPLTTLFGSTLVIATSFADVLVIPSTPLNMSFSSGRSLPVTYMPSPTMKGMSLKQHKAVIASG